MKKLLLLFLLTSCHPATINYNDPLLLKWRSDTMGNKNIRTIEMARDLTSRFDLQNRSPKELIRLLGAPDEGDPNETYPEIRYFIGKPNNFALDSSCKAIFYYPENHKDQCRFDIVCE